jgi:hypothetical protein
MQWQQWAEGSMKKFGNLSKDVFDHQLCPAIYPLQNHLLSINTLENEGRAKKNW